MTLIKNYYQRFLSNYNDERSRLQFINIIQSLIFKGGAILCNFLLVPITISYLSVETYGLWIAISSMIAWISFLDGGLGNGLKNKLSEAIATKNIILAKTYISSAYFGIVIISIFLILLFTIFQYVANWDKILSIKSTKIDDLDLIIYIVFLFFCLKFIFELINSILAAIQKVGYSNLISFITNIIILISVYFLTLNVKENKLLYLSIVVSIIPIIVLLFFSIYVFKKNQILQQVKPSISCFRLNEFKDIYQLGIQFFIIQMAFLIIFSTDNFIILKLYDGKQVAIYNIAFKYFSIISLLWSIIIAPYWVAFNEAYHKKDFDWMKKTIFLLIRIWFLIVFITIIMLIFSPFVFKIWIGESIIIPFSLCILMSIFILISTFNNIFANFINGIGLIRIQMIGSLFLIVFNIPLCVFFSLKLNLGINGIMLGTIVSLLPGTLLGITQFRMIISNKAEGIWNK
jgi:O-antigen/teichoic acid export membrane protein